MIRFVEVIDVPLAPGDAFDAIADFSATTEWDPGVRSAVETTARPLRAGSRFRLDVALLGRVQTYGYAITDFERPARLVLQGGNATTRLTDEITFVQRGQGTRITYEVRCELVGPVRLAEPLVDLVLPIIGRRAADGLRRYGRRLSARARYAADRAAAVTAKDRDAGEASAKDLHEPPNVASRPEPLHSAQGGFAS